jgi:hypothetical protein
MASCPAQELHPANFLSFLQSVFENIPSLQPLMTQKPILPILNGIRTPTPENPRHPPQFPSNSFNPLSDLLPLPARRHGHKAESRTAETDFGKWTVLCSPDPSAGGSGSSHVPLKVQLGDLVFDGWLLVNGIPSQSAS